MYVYVLSLYVSSNVAQLAGPDLASDDENLPTDIPKSMDEIYKVS